MQDGFEGFKGDGKGKNRVDSFSRSNRKSKVFVGRMSLMSWGKKGQGGGEDKWGRVIGYGSFEGVWLVRVWQSLW